MTQTKKIKSFLKNIFIFYYIKKNNLFDAKYYLNKYPLIKKNNLIPLLHYVKIGFNEGLSPYKNHDQDLLNYVFQILYYKKKAVKALFFKIKLHSETHIDYEQFRTKKFGIRSYKTRYNKNKEPEILLFFNGYDNKKIFGGQATTLRICVHLAQKKGFNLKIIDTIPSSPNLNILKKVLNIEFEIDVKSQTYSDIIEFNEKDLILSNMWYSANKILNTTAFINNKIFYILQELETYFYDHGDTHLICYQTLSDYRLNTIINSSLLYNSLISSEKYKNISSNSMFFEPAFEKTNSVSFSPKSKYKFFFYGRPTHQRNLYYFGMDVLLEAFKRNLFNLDEWEFYMAGDECQQYTNIGLNLFKNLEVLSWNDYQEFIKDVDLAYSMIYTPHPSYPPLDTANSGGICLTNIYENKKNLNQYSQNIICADLNLEAMLIGLEKAIELTKNTNKRAENFKNNNILNDWNLELDKIYSYVDSIK